MKIKDNILYKFLKKSYSDYIHWRCDIKRKPYISKIKELLIDLNESSNKGNIPCLISSNCFAGRIMQDLKVPYNSPTEGLYFWAPDYIEFLKDLPHYLKAEITFVDHSKYTIGDERRAKWSHWYPIGLLDGKVEIHFLHYYTEKEAAEKWYRRAARVDLKNVLIIGMDQNLCSEKEIEEFSKLPYKNKIFFSRFDLPFVSNEFMPEFEGCESVGDPYRKADTYYRHLINHFQHK